MRIAISARSLDYPACGVKEYLLNLVRALLEIDKTNEYLVFHSSAEHLGSFPGAREIALGTQNRLAFDWLSLPLAIGKFKPDLLFTPSSNMPAFCACPCVTSMLDLGYFHKDLKMYKGLDTIYMKWAIRFAARKAARLIAISEHTKRDLLRLTEAREADIDVIYLAAAQAFLEKPKPEATEKLKKKRGLTRPYFLYTGNVSPRKNLKTLLAAYAAIAAESGCDLVLTGGMAWGVEFDSLLPDSSLKQRIIRLGELPRDEMPALYAASLAYVFPSLFEGFGLPVLEAQACGAPVVCSNATSLPEVGGEAALYVDPLDVEGLGQAMLSLAKSEPLRAEFIEKGYANARRFSWHKTARETLDSFHLAKR